MGAELERVTPTRTVVIGNSGSGKSTLAAKLAEERGSVHLDLDTLAWEATDPPSRRALDVVGQQLDAFVAENERWVVEGCYADLAELMLVHANELIFLDLPVEQCRRHARARPWEPHKYPSKAAQDANLEMLLDWIAAYPSREGVMGRPAHLALYENFAGTKRRVSGD